MDKGIIQIYYGEGQGKTSAALGNAIRKASNGQSAYVVQFMKGQLDTEYLTRLEPEVKVFRFERCSEGFDALDEAEKQEQKQNIQNGLNFAKKALVTGQCDMLVLDEVLELVKEGMATEDQILEVRVPMQDVVEMKNGAKKSVSKKMFPGYVLINMVMNDDTWYVVRNTRGVTGFVGPGSKPVPLTDMEMKPLGIKKENIEVDFTEGDTVVVTGGVWKDTIGVIQAMNHGKQSVTINVELFGRETPVEISFADVKLNN